MTKELNDNDWFHVGIGIVKKYKKHIKLSSTDTHFIISDIEEVINDIEQEENDIKLLNALGWFKDELVLKYKII